MSLESLDSLLRTFRRQLLLTRVLRIGGLLAMVGLTVWMPQQPEPASKRLVLMVGTAAILSWVAILMNAARTSREVRTGSILLHTGQLDDAEVWFRRVMSQVSISTRNRLVACQHMASLLLHRDAHQKVVAICRELLRHRLNRLRSVWISTRLMLADSLLRLDRVGEAYDAFRPVYEMPLSLSDRMKLLPIQLRYELASDHSASAVQSLPEKIKIAELLDSSTAALVHALLAEACRRESLMPQCRFLTERASLYSDLPELAQRHQVIAPIAVQHGDGRADVASAG